MLTKAEIKRIRSLGDKAGRQAEGLFAAEGEKLVGELLASGLAVRGVYRTGENVTAAEMGRISFLKTPTPVLAVAEIPSFPAAEPGDGGLCLALDDVQDPGNVGTIIRLADWFGVRDVYCSPATADCWSPTGVQATMGAVLRVRVPYA
uniref:TrmH family RNA methyltransferase n=1 Tax=Rikenella microfusus TaxID=28139 RepID=UPI003AB1B72E